MRKMKDSGVEWIGEIPEDWEVKPLKYLGRFSSSGIDKKIVKNEDLVKIINYVDVYNNPNFELYNGNYMTVSASKNQIKEHLVKKGDLIFTPSSETVEEIGMSALVMEDLENTAFSYHVIRFVFNNDNDVFFRYRRYLCNNSYVYNHFMILAKGTTRKTLKRSDFNDTKVILPPLKTQIKIASHLDNKLIEISNVKEAIVEELQTLEVYKKSVITEAVTKGLDKNAEMKDSGIEWIGEIPKHWNVEKLKYLGTSNNETAIYNKGERFIGLEHVGSFNGKVTGQDTDYDECETPIFEKGDFLFSKLRPYLAKGFLAERGGFCTSELIRIKFNEEQCNRFFKYLLLSHKFIDLINSMTYGVKMPRTSWQELKEQFLTVPPGLEQEEIANYLDEKCGSIDEVITIKQNQLSLLDEYKKSLIYEYVTGKREV